MGISTRFFLLLFGLLLYTSVQGQDRRVTGVVTSIEDGAPVPGVNVLIKGASTGTVTDINGAYTLEAIDEQTVLVFSFVGYNTEEVLVGNQSVIDVTLSPDIETLSEVVVIGYGQVKKTDLTGSVASVKSEVLTQRPISSLDQGLKGITPGVQVISGSGEPGSAISLRIRGASSINASAEPLYVIDGFPISNSGVSTSLTNLDNSSPNLNPLASINPSDIESIEVLKDASATAIYGSRGANGVVLITTKRGSAGRPTVSYSGYAGPQWVIKKLDLLNADQFVELANRGNVWSQTYNNTTDPTTVEPVYTVKTVNGQRVYVVNNDNEVTGTDWQDEIFRTAPIQSHQLTISGGAENSKYILSGNYFNQQGIIINSGLKRGSIRFNGDFDVAKWLKIGNNFLLSRTENNGVFATTNNAAASVVGAAINMPAIVPVRNEDGTYAFMEDYSKFGTTTNNPVALANEARNDQFINRVLASLFFDITFTKGLVYRANFGTDYADTRQELYHPSTYFEGRRYNSEGGIGHVNTNSWLHESTLTYDHTFNESHNLNVLAGFMTQSFFSRDSRLVKRDFDSDELENYAIQNGNEFVPERSATGQAESRLDSWLGRINYNFRSKYYITLTGRADGSSRFGSGNKWGFFPSGAVAWRISDETFVGADDVLSDLKLRASYGESGNQAIGNYNSLVRISSSPTTLGTGTVVGFYPNTPGNPNLQWESTTQINAGLDLELFRRFGFTFDYYVKTTNDLIFNVTIPASSGYTSVVKNAGSMENRGWEFSFSAPIFTKAFTWTLGGNLSENQNKVLDLGESDEILVQNSLISEGQPLGAFYSYVFDGIFQTDQEIDNTPYAADYNERSPNRPLVPGHVKVRDLDGDGVISPEDRDFVGNPNPRFIYGLTSNMTYKNFSLDFIMTGVSGIDVWNKSYRSGFNGNLGGTADLINSWTPENRNNFFPAATYTFTGETREPFIRSSSFPINQTVEDGSFFRLDNVKLGYTFNTARISWLSILNVYVAANNLLTITNYKGFDPDVNSRLGQGNAILGRDNATYPRAKSVLFGLNVTF